MCVCHCPRFDPAEDVIASAGYRDYQFLIVILGDDGIYRHGEIQVRYGARARLYKQPLARCV